MAVTIEHTGCSEFPWVVYTHCRSKPEAFAKAARIEEVDPAAFIPAEALAVAAGEPATGGGGSSQIPVMPDALATDSDDNLGLSAPQ